MMQHSQRQNDPMHLDGYDSNRAFENNHDSAVGRSQVREAESAQELYELLEYLGVGADMGVTRCFWHVEGAPARAVASIKEWLTYLPQNCVAAMVNDSWHWST